MEQILLPVIDDAGSEVKAPSRFHRILFVWLPVRQIFPVGIGYLVNWIHRIHPEISLEVLDLTRFSEGEQLSDLRRRSNVFLRIFWPTPGGMFRFLLPMKETTPFVGPSSSITLRIF